MPIPNEAEGTLLDVLRSGAVALRVILYQNAVVLGSGTTLADLQEANFDGYAPADPAGYSVPVMGADGRGESLTPLLTFTKAEGPNTNTIHGKATVLRTPGGDRLIEAKAFKQPVEVVNVGQKVEFFSKLQIVEFELP